MASLLHRLGLLAARRAKTILAAWFAVLAIAVTSFLTFGGQLTDQITLPDLETTEVADRLVEEMPDAGGGSATAVIQAEDGTFTDEQISAISDLAEEVEADSAVHSVTDPFATEQELADGRAEIDDASQELQDGEDQLSDARAEAEEGQEELDANAAELESGQEQLDEAIEEAEEAGAEEAMAEQFEEQQAEIDAGREGLDEAQQQIDEGNEEIESSASELESGREELERNESMLELSEQAGMVSEGDDAAIMMITFNDPLENVGTEELASVSDLLLDADIDGVEVLPSGDLNMELPHLFSVAEAVGLMIAAVVLLIMLGTFVGAGLPLLNALIGVGVGVAGALAFSGVVEMMSMTPILGLMLGLAVGIDYSLFILHRHRRQLKSGMKLHASIGLANGTAGNAVVFAGATVVIALLALNVTGLPFLALMGTVAAVCVVIAVLVAVTVTPALLSLVGTRILNRREKRRAGRGSGATVTEPMSTPKAVVIAVGAVAALAILAIPTFSLRLGLPDASSDPEDSTSYQAYHVTEESFGQGMNGPLVVVADLPEAMDDDAATDEQIAIAEALGDQDRIDYAVPIGLNDDNSVAAFQMVPTDGPASVSVEELVHDIRDGVLLDGSDVSDVELSVAGFTAANIDMSDVISDAMPLYLALVVGLSVVLMIMVFRSLLLPVIATLGFIGSVTAALGAVVAVFQWGWLGSLFGITEPGPVLTFLPVITIGILFGLAMDYQLFTASGMREAYVHGAPARLAVRQGLHLGRSVVTAAALIMGSVFGGFIFTPDPMIASIGLALSVGVLLDAFVVRLLLVPALLHLAGPAAWWLPKWLDRIVPDVDVEGSALEREVPEAQGHDAEQETRETSPAKG